MTDDSRPNRPRRQRIRRALLSVTVLAVLIGAATYLWSRTLVNKAARIKMGDSRGEVEMLLGSPVAMTARVIRGKTPDASPREYVTELYDPTFGMKVSINSLFDPLGWFPFDLDRTEWPVRLHYDDNGCVDMIQRGDVVIQKSETGLGDW